MINVGVDVHKRICQACLKDERGSIVEELRFPNNQEGASRLATILKKHGEAKVAMESTGNLWVKLYDRLDEEANIDVILTNPKKTRVIAEAKIKTDKLDARLLADLVRADLVARSYVPSYVPFLAFSLYILPFRVLFSFNLLHSMQFLGVRFRFWNRSSNLIHLSILTYSVEELWKVSAHQPS